MRLSVISTLYHSAPYLREFCSRVAATCESLTDDYEIVLVNDGSPDDSLAMALELQRENARIKIVDLASNYGQHRAMMTGLEHANGEWLFLIDADLEEAPEVLREFWTTLQNSNADVVYGVQQARKGRLFERLSGAVFYKIFNLLSTHRIPENVSTVRLMSRRYVDSLLQFRERELMIAGLWAATGYQQVPHPIAKRSKGTTSYSIRKRIGVFVNALTSFSAKPLMLVFYLGALIIFGSTVAAGWIVACRLFVSEYSAGWPSLIVSIWMLGGVTVFCQGLIGIYLSKIFVEVKRRPYTIVRHVYERSLEKDLCTSSPPSVK